MVQLSNDGFVAELAKLFVETKDKGTVFLCMKPYKVETKSKKGKGEIEEPRCLVRAKVGKRKITTLVKAKDLMRFQLSYNAVIKNAFSQGLKKHNHAKKRV